MIVALKLIIFSMGVKHFHVFFFKMHLIIRVVAQYRRKPFALSWSKRAVNASTSSAQTEYFQGE
jgi:hypothetical protein